MLVWWPFCDFFFKNVVLALVKLIIPEKRHMIKKWKKWRSYTFSLCNSDNSATVPRAAKMELEALVFKSCTFYISQKQNRDRMRKKVKQTKNKKNVKNDGKMEVGG